MKNLKKIMAVLIAAVLVFAMGITVYATPTGEGGEGGGDGTQTEADGNTQAETGGTKIITLTGGKAGHTYTLYQVFTGTVETVEGTEMLTNIQWGADAPATLKNDYNTAAAAALAIHNQNDARAFAQQYASAFTGGTPLSLSADGDVVFSGLKEGYYLIADTSGPTGVVEGDYDSAYIVQVVKDVNGAIKGSGATSNKEVTDPETNTASTSDAAAYNIGDAVPFKLTATTADNVAAYKKYHITFQDKQSAGLDAPTTYTVTVLGKNFTVPATGDNPDPQTTTAGTKITVTKVTPDTGNTFAIKVEFEPVAVGETAAATYLNSECNSKSITVDYTSVLNSSAAIGLPGNTNEMHITYSNNPENADGGDEGKTPDDTVKVFTYKPVIDKVDADGNALAGAGFTLYQEVTETITGAQTGAAIKSALGNTIETSALADAKYYIAKAMTTVGTNDAQFQFEGLADGTYVLVETTIPTGFNPFSSVEFDISSTVTEDAITTLSGETPFTTTNPGADGTVEATKKDGSKHSLGSGELYAEIENNSGQVLPSTGGIGTTIFYIIGGVIVLAAVIILVVRSKKSSAK